MLLLVHVIHHRWVRMLWRNAGVCFITKFFLSMVHTRDVVIIVVVMTLSVFRKAINYLPSQDLVRQSSIVLSATTPFPQ